jgi:hypothetical protein
VALLKQSTAYTRMFLMIDSSDHISAKTGLTVTVTLSKAGAAFGAAGGTVTEVANGWYKIVLTTTDTNTLGDLVVHCTSTGADATDFVDQVGVRLVDDLAFPATSGRSMVVDASGLVDANVVKVGPTGSGTAQTARDIGASVLLSTGTGTGQLDFTSGVVKANATQFAGQTITAGAGVTIPSSIASPTNITAGTITTATNLTTNNDKTGYSVGTGGIAAASFAAGAIDAAAIAANAIGSSEFSQAAADVVWTSAARTLTSSTRVKKNTALAGFMFFMADSADHVTPKTGLTITAQRAIDGAAFGACANAAAEIANGIYKIDLSAADLNGNNIILKFTSAGADQTSILVVTSD